MPSGISPSAVNPAALVQRPASPPREQEPSAPSGAQSAQAVLATETNNIVRAPEARAGAQGVDNQTAASQTNEQNAPGGVQTPAENRLQAQVDQGLGGNVDITV